MLVVAFFAKTACQSIMFGGAKPVSDMINMKRAVRTYAYHLCGTLNIYKHTDG